MLVEINIFLININVILFSNDECIQLINVTPFFLNKQINFRYQKKNEEEPIYKQGIIFQVSCFNKK